MHQNITTGRPIAPSQDPEAIVLLGPCSVTAWMILSVTRCCKGLLRHARRGGVLLSICWPSRMSITTTQISSHSEASENCHSGALHCGCIPLYACTSLYKSVNLPDLQSKHRSVWSLVSRIGVGCLERPSNGHPDWYAGALSYLGMSSLRSTVSDDYTIFFRGHCGCILYISHRLACRTLGASPGLRMWR